MKTDQIKVRVTYSAGAYHASIGKLRASSTMDAPTAVDRVTLKWLDKYGARCTRPPYVDLSSNDGQSETWTFVAQFGAN